MHRLVAAMSSGSRIAESRQLRTQLILKGKRLRLAISLSTLKPFSLGRTEG